MAANRWDWLDGLKPESAIMVAVKHVARMIADELTEWPPAVSHGEGQDSERFAEVLRAGAPRPSLPAFEEAVKRARWELTRDYHAIDFYERNHRLAEACPSARDQLASEVIQHYILESFFTLMERTENRVKRKDVLVGLELLARHVEARWMLV